MSNTIRDIIQEYRHKDIEGLGIILTPFRIEDSEAVVNLRNQDYVMWCFNQPRRYDIAGQIEWYNNYYLSAEDDIFWCIRRKDGRFIGMIRIYNIDNALLICNQGSFAIDGRYKDEAPYAVEALVMTLDFAYDCIGVRNILHENRVGNKTMNNLSRKLGAYTDGQIDFRGAEYTRWILPVESYRKNRDRFYKTIEYWFTKR